MHRPCIETYGITHLTEHETDGDIFRHSLEMGSIASAIRNGPTFSEYEQSFLYEKFRKQGDAEC